MTWRAPDALPWTDALRDELGHAVHAQRLGSSPRSRVWSVEVAGRAIVVKQHVGGPDADSRFAREWTALTLGRRARPAVVPDLLATDDSNLVLVLEQLRDDGPANDWPVAWATSLARLHATTREADRGALPFSQPPDSTGIEAFLRLVRALGEPVADGGSRELELLLDRLDPRKHRALLHGDPCPGNDLHAANGVRFVDLEQASLGDGLVELAYLRIGFPTCWCATSVPDRLVVAAENAYRVSWREATGTDLPTDLTAPLADACAGWLLRGDALVPKAERQGDDHLARVMDHEWHWGTATARQRLAHRLRVVADLTSTLPDLSGLSKLTAATAQSALRRWGSGPLPATGTSHMRTRSFQAGS